jgi:UDP-glucuronate decarboxylase
MHDANRCVLVTGAAGFLGSHLADALLDRGYDVTGVDDFSTSARDSRHHAALQRRVGYRFVERDISEPAALHTLAQFSAIFNMACPASPPAYQRMPMHTLMTSVMGAFNCTELLRQCDLLARGGNGRRPILVHASTSEVYGDPLVTPQSETYWGNVNPWGPRSCYDEGKRAAEAVLWTARSEGLDVRPVRIFNTYGPRMLLGDGRVITEFARAALLGDPLPVYGDGSQTRSLCYVDDLIAGILAVHDAERPQALPVNLGNPREVSIIELARVFQEVTGRHVGTVTMPRPADDPMIRRPDISLAVSTLGWEPRVSLEDGLRRTYAWFAGA